MPGVIGSCSDAWMKSRVFPRDACGACALLQFVLFFI